MSPQPFPHLGPAESLVWARFLQLHGPEWDRYDYDVHVGQGHDIDPAWPDFIKTMVQKLSPKRIDVVGYKGGSPTIFEVRPKATRSVAGGLLMYRYLFVQQFPTLPAPSLAAVVTRTDPDLARYLASEGVTVYLVDPVIPV